MKNCQENYSYAFKYKQKTLILHAVIEIYTKSFFSQKLQNIFKTKQIIQYRLFT